MDTGGYTPNVTVEDLLNAGLHFGHQTKRWNPKMKKYIFGTRNGIYIIDLHKSLELLKVALNFLYRTAAEGKSVLFVGTKQQAHLPIVSCADRTRQPYVTNRWLGGTLTNNVTIRKSIGRMQEIEALEKSGAFEKMPKKEAARLKRELEKLRSNLEGIKDMMTLPGAVFVIDTEREKIAISEANRLGIPVVAIVDTNSDPDPINYPIPGNDDASRAIELICKLAAEAIERGIADHTQIAAAEAQQKSAEDDRAKASESAAKATSTAAGAPAKAEPRKEVRRTRAPRAAETSAEESSYRSSADE
ncbi:MAG: 30S ribosomal protein S2 [Kiritimatiellae bacterium]|nr:30S ribosomal protein S2 [Kiritimatiellia bacterium]MDW8458035.1 30S ribosomal protein S2 [Verrucomicrobiota bacterium]